MRTVLKRGARRVGAGVAATALAVTALSLLTGGTANAETVPAGYCQPDSLCMYENPNYGDPDRGVGLVVDPAHLLASGQCGELPPQFSRTVSSIKNWTNRNIIFYTESGCGGFQFIAPPGAEFADLAGFNDLIVSIRF